MPALRTPPLACPYPYPSHRQRARPLLPPEPPPDRLAGPLPLEHETLHWTRAQGERLTHVFEVSHWDWPESRETNDRTLDFFRRACAAPEKPAEE